MGVTGRARSETGPSMERRERQETMSDQRWSVGTWVGLVAFVSLALLPWAFLWWRGESLRGVDFLAAGLVWGVIGTMALANSANWRKKS